MSARRMAAVQPSSFELSKSAHKQIDVWVKKYPSDRQRSALIPALWIAQKDAGGWLPELAMRAVADKLGMAYIRVFEVVTFYTMFNMSPVGEHFIQLCGTTPCWLRGSDNLKDVCAKKIGAQNTVSADGKLSWLEVECLGACANAPMVQISNAAGDSYYEDLTAESFEALLDDLAAGKTPEYGPQNSRHTSEPLGGAKALISDAIYNQEAGLRALPNAGKKAQVVYHNADPKGRRATTAGRKVKPKKPPATKTSPKASVKTPKKVSKPKVLYTDGATDGAPDDLKKIKGIGPKFEKELNVNGVYYFRQIGAWKAADVKTVEDKIASLATGRVKRDEWVKQGKALAKTDAKKGKS
ncbi:MAG: NADH-quinone oxidoreductase subunit NuoE [Litorimonas sp.]